MRVITNVRVKQAMQEYPQWWVGLQLWLQTFSSLGLRFESYQQVKDLWKSQSGWNVDRVAAKNVTDNAFQGENYDLYIFDIHKNECRALVRIDSMRNKIFIRDVLSHAKYDKWIKSHVN